MVLIEGRRALRTAIEAQADLELVALRSDTEMDDLPAATPVYRLAPRAFERVTQTVTPQGVLGVARARAVDFAVALDAARGARQPLVVLDGVADPGNVGAICRSLVAAGLTALVVLEGGADPFSPKAVRASAGLVFRLRVGRGARDDLSGLTGFGLSASGGQSLFLADLEGAEVLAFGSEAHGLTRSTLTPLTIPMASGVESLNVAAAAAVVVFELARRRAA